MKERTLFKKAALTAAVSLALAQSVMAMPSGGQMIEGHVMVNDKNFIGGVFRDGMTVTALSPSIINWQNFDIEAGKSLTFNTASAPLLNRVVGGNVSEIYGTLNQTGAYPLFLVNTNGILVGNGATINASSMVLSTLAITNENFLGARGYSNDYEFATPSGKTVAAPITIQGAKINMQRAKQPITSTDNAGSGFYTVPGIFTAIGGTVEIADGVVFDLTGGSSQIVGAQSAWKPMTSNDVNCSASTTKDNTVIFMDSKAIGGHGDFVLQGGSVGISHSTIQVETGGGDISIGAYSTDRNSGTKQMTTDHAVAIDNSSLLISGESKYSHDDLLKIAGGKINVSDSALRADILSVFAGESYKNSDDGGRILQFGSTTHSLSLKNAKIDAGTAALAGGQVVLDKTTLTGTNDVAVAAAHKAKANYVYESEPAGYSPTFIHSSATTTPDNTVSLTNGTSITSPQTTVAGGTVIVSGKSTATAADDGKLFVVANTAGTKDENGVTVTGTPGTVSVSTDAVLLQNGVDVTNSIATIRPNPDPIPTPTPTPEPTPTPSPDPAPTPEIPTAKTLAENVENGKTAMSTVLANHATAETRKSGVKMLIESINQSTASGAVKSAKISGVFLAILDDKSLTDAEKVSLQREIVQTFHPTQIANAEANQTIDNASQAGASAAAGDTQPKNTERTFPEEEMPIVKGL